MICKHFNLSIEYIDEYLDLGKYYCLLAEALDAEELADHNLALLTAIAFHSPKQIKNWKWNSPDKAGTVDRDYVPRSRTDQVTETLKDFGREVFKFNVDRATRNPDRAMEFARITGRRILFMNPDGFLFDEAVQVITDYAQDGSAIIVQVDYDGNFV